VAELKYPLSLVIRAVDRASAPLRQISKNIEKSTSRVTAPFRRLGNRLTALGEATGLPKVVEGFKGVGSAVGKVGSEVFALGKKLALMAAGAGFALFSIVRGAINAGDKLGEMAQRTGLAVDAYASLQFAAAQADVEQEQFNSAMDQFNKRLGEAKAGGGPLLNFLKKVSPALADQVKNATSTEQALSLMTTAFERLPDSQRRAALSAAAFGRSGLQVGEWLHMGSAAIQEQQRKYLGLVGSQEEFVKGAGEMDNVMREAEVAFLGVRNALAAELFPVFKDLLGIFRDLLKDNRGSLVKWIREVAAGFQGWLKGGGIQRITDGFKRFFATVDPFVQKLGGWPVVIGGIATAILTGPLLGALAGLAASLASLAATLGTVAPIAGLAIGAMIGIGRAAFAAGGDIAAAVEGWKQHVRGFTEFVKGVFTLDLQTAWQGIKDIFSGGGKFFAGLIDGWVSLMKLSLQPLLKPIEWAMSAVGFDVGSLPKLSNLLGASAAATPPPAALASGSPGNVTVSFANVPKGVRVTADQNVSAEVNYSMGPTMSGG
jgi:phage-related minor tail protein